MIYKRFLVLRLFFDLRRLVIPPLRKDFLVSKLNILRCDASEDNFFEDMSSDLSVFITPLMQRVGLEPGFGS